MEASRPTHAHSFTNVTCVYYLTNAMHEDICFSLHSGSHVVHASEVVGEYVCVGLIPCVKKLLIDVGIIPLIIQR